MNIVFGRRLGMSLLAAAFYFALGCTKEQQQTVQTVLDYTNEGEQVACVVAKSVDLSDATKIAQLCGFVQTGQAIAQSVLDFVTRIMNESKLTQAIAVARDRSASMPHRKIQ